MEKAVNLNRKNPVPLLHKGIILGKMRRNGEALKIFERMERRFGSHPMSRSSAEYNWPRWASTARP